MSLSQPNDSTFDAVAWGTQFHFYLATTDDYQIVRGEDGWYYYAQLDGNGEFTPTDSIVTINDPAAISYQLDRSSSRISYLDSLEDGSSSRRHFYF